MKSVVNIIASILLAITISVVMGFFTLGNYRFLAHEFKKYDYYNEVYKDITKTFDNEKIAYKISAKDVTDDINKYVKHSFNIKIVNPVKEDKNNIYISKVTFNNKFKNIDMDLIKNITFISALILISVTGIMFKKTKKVHNLKHISIITSILLVLVYGGVKVFVSVSIPIFNKCIIDASYYILFISGFMLSFSIAKVVKNKLK